MKRVLLLGDSRWRDTFPLALMKYRLEQEWGDELNVRIVSFDLWQQAVTMFKPHVTVLNHAIGNRNREIIRLTKLNDGKVVVLPTEGRPNTHEQIEWYIKQNAGDHIDLFLSWGEQTHDPRIPNSQVVGCPRFEIYTNFKDMITSKEAMTAKNRLNGPVTVIASSFPQAKYSYQGIGFNEQDWRDLSVTDISTRTDPTAFARSEYESMLHFKRDVLVAVGSRVVKPHPMEDVHDWRAYCDQWGFTLISQEYIYNLLSMADSWIARTGCLTIVEAYLMGVKTYDFQYGEENEGPAFESIDSDYIQRYFTLAGSPSRRAAKLVYALLGDVRDNPATGELLQFYRTVKEHENQHIYPNLASMHLGKTVLPSLAGGMVSKMEEIEK